MFKLKYILIDEAYHPSLLMALAIEIKRGITKANKPQQPRGNGPNTYAKLMSMGLLHTYVAIGNQLGRLGFVLARNDDVTCCQVWPAISTKPVNLSIQRDDLIHHCIVDLSGSADESTRHCDRGQRRLGILVHISREGKVFGLANHDTRDQCSIISKIDKLLPFSTLVLVVESRHPIGTLAALLMTWDALG